MHPLSYKPVHILVALGAIASVLFLAFVLLGYTRTVEATHVIPLTFHDPVELHGYAWSDTIGWISLNCAEGGPSGENICLDSDYKLTVNPNGQNWIRGYAWSDNIGWIKFGSLSNFPAGDLETNAHVHVYEDPVQLSGWVRACAGTLNGDCSTMVDHPDGWDGWISLRSGNLPVATDTVPYSIAVGASNFSGYAWGSDLVGWISFNGVSFTPPCVANTSCNATYNGTISTSQWCEVQPEVLCTTGLVCSPTTSSCELITIDGSITATPPLVRKTSTSRLTWSVVNPAEVSVCKVEGSNAETFNGTSGTSVTTLPLTYAETVYTFSCIPAGGGGYIEVASTTIKTLPMISET